MEAPKKDLTWKDIETPASLLNVLAMLNVFISQKDNFSDEEIKIFGNIRTVVQGLLEVGLDYSLLWQRTTNTDFAKRFNMHFIHRLRDPTHRARSGPRFTDSDHFQRERARLVSLYHGGELRIVNCTGSATEPQSKLMEVLSLPFVFRNYNRSLRLLDHFGNGASTTSDFLKADLQTIFGTSGKWTAAEAESGELENNSVFQLYMDADKKVNNEKIQDQLRATRRIERHPEGGQMSERPLYTWIARLYVVIAVAFSILVSTFNLARRDNVYERVTDMVQTATLLLVSVFGLLKLTSEDPNVIRNTFLGYRIVRTSNDVVRAWRLEDEVDLKKLLALIVSRFTWLEPDGACYAVGGQGKGIALSHGITTESLYEIGADFDGNRYFISPYARFQQERNLQLRGMYVQIQQGQGFLVKFYGETAHIESGDVKLLYPNIAEPIHFSLVAGKGTAEKTT